MENEFLILLQAKLDEAKSKGNVNADIKEIQNQIDKLKIQAEIDPKIFSDLIQRIEQILNQKIDISNIGIDSNKAVQSAQQTGKQIGNAVNQGVSQGLGNIEKLESFQKSLLNAGMDSTLVSSVADEIGRLNVQIDSLNQSVSNMSGGKNILSVNIAGVDELGQSVKLVRQFDVETGELVKTIESVSTAQQKTTSTIEKDITTYTNKLKDFQTQYSNANIDYSQFNKVFDAFKNGEATVNQLSVAFNELKNSAKASVQNLKSQDSSLNEIQQTINNMRDFPAMIDSLKTGMSELKDQTKVADISIDDLSESYNELKSVMDSVGGKVPLTDEWTKKYRELMSTVVSLTKQVETLKRVESSDNSSVKAKDISYKVDLGNYDKDFKVLTESFKRLGLSAEEIEVRVKDVSVALDKLKGKNLETLVQDEKDFVTALKKSQNEARILRTDLENIYNPKRQMNLSTNIQNWLSKNTRAAKDAKQSLQEYYRELTGGRVSVDRLEFIERELKKIDAEQRGLGQLGKNLKDQFTEAGKSFTQWLSVSSAVMLGISRTKEAVSELKEVNTLLTEISKANDKLSKSDLTNIGNNSFDVASKYGKTATNYLSGVQEMSRAGYENAESMAELSVAAQGAGDMTAELANKYIIATDVAFKMNGSVEALTATLDGANNITNHNAVNMTDLAEGISVVGSQAASSQMKVNEITAAIGTMVATTQKSGSEMGNAFKGILMNLQQVTGDVGDGEDVIDAESLTKYEKACAELGVSLKEVKNGVISLKEPMQILKELAEEYTKLDEADAKRANLRSSVGGKYRANALNAILENYDLYEKMLQDYADGMGSMATEAEKTANSWEGSLNRLSNTWTDTIGNIVNSDAVITITNGLNSVLSLVNNITDSLGSLGSLTVGAGIFASFKNVGRPKMSGLICY